MALVSVFAIKLDALHTGNVCTPYDSGSIWGFTACIGGGYRGVTRVTSHPHGAAAYFML